MSTEAQLTANRANAQNSTGPTTPEGKARAAQNSAKHGLASRNILLKGENLDHWLALRDQLRETFQVEGQSCFLDDATHATWKLMRIEEWQTRIIESAIDDAPVPNALALLFGADHLTVLKQLERYERSARTTLKRATDQLRATAKARAAAAADSEASPSADRTDPIPAPEPPPPTYLNGPTTPVNLVPALDAASVRPGK